MSRSTATSRPFTDADKQETEAFEEYSDLDYLGRCGTAYANVGQELMPADGEKRGSIGQVKPNRMAYRQV